MKINLETPYKEKYKYGYLLVNREDRKMIILYNSDRDRTTISYARYLLSVKLGKELENDYDADHKDENRTNDNLDNIQLLTKTENIKKYQSKMKGAKYLKLKCPNCGLEFDRQYRNTFERKGSKFHCCSKECLHEFISNVLWTEEELIDIGKNQVIKTFYLNKITGIVTKID
jgi:hypothetical protein